VISEITNETQLIKVKYCISSGLIKIVKLTDFEEMKDFFTLCKRLGKGESSCIALATANNWIVCSDDKKRVPEAILNRLGTNHLLTTDSLLNIAVAKGFISEKAKSAILFE
jgi:predicted nucleic acid-binding protein